MSGLSRQIRYMAVCGRADGRDVVVDGMLWRTAGKSVCYAGELLFPSLLMQFGDICHLRQPVAIRRDEFCFRWSRLQLVYLIDGVHSG